jgi:hypothetical protein
MDSAEKKVAFSIAYLVMSCACIKMEEEQEKKMMDAVLGWKFR